MHFYPWRQPPPPQAVIPDKAAKLLRLALDHAAGDGEWRAAAELAIAVLRASGVKPEELLDRGPRRPAPPPPPPPGWSASKSYRWSSRGPARMFSAAGVARFGKYKGVSIRAIPGDYLVWVRGEDFHASTIRMVEEELRRRRS